MNARALLTAAVALSALACAKPRASTKPAPVVSARVPAPSAHHAQSAPFPALPALDLASIRLEDFADEELELAFHLAHFRELADSVALSGPERGYIGLRVWREPSAPFNARVMENILALAWFYTEKRPWNPFHAHPALRVRLEAALEFWCRSQAPSGAFSEYGPQQWGLPPTAFATKFLGEALILLARGAPIDAGLVARARAAQARAIRVVLSDPSMWAQGRSYTNQFDNVWGGALAYLSLGEDPEVRGLFERRFRESGAELQSPAGYYYEADGPDFGYTLSTHGHSLRQAWEWFRGSALEAVVVERERRWVDWLARNALPEPDGRWFALSHGSETRQRLDDFEYQESPPPAKVPLASAFAESAEEARARFAALRRELSATWPRVKPLVPAANAYSPYAFLHARQRVERPSTRERDAARRQLPPVARKSFTELRRDDRRNQLFLFVRRPGYYATFAAGEQRTAQQHFGLELFWTPELGALLQNQSGTEPAWGTLLDGAPATRETQALEVTLSMAGKPLDRDAPGVRELPSGDLVVTYPIAALGSKTLTFGKGGVRVEVRHPGAFTEILPLLVARGEPVALTPGRATASVNGGRYAVTFDERAIATVADAKLTVAGKSLVLLSLKAQGELRYALEPAALTPRRDGSH